ncbi:MAG: MFS transporter [Chloroflexota bacterium]|nr:MAG: MFS transporter [Chloroflexota bacterium]
MKGLPDNVQKYPEPSFSPRSFPWVIALLGALLLFIVNVNGVTFGVFFKPIAEELAWSRGSVAGALAIRSLLVAVFALPTGYLADRFGPRRVLLPSCLFMGIGFLMYSKVTSMWQLYLVQGLLMGMALSAPYVCVVSTVAKWHTERPGRALGIASAGVGLTSVLSPPIATTLIESIGWRDAMIVLGVFTIAMGVPACIVMKAPSSTQAQRSGRPNQHRSPFAVWRKLPRLLNNRVFLAIVLAFLLYYTAAHLLLTHLVNYVTDIGLSPLIAGTMMTAMGIASIIGRLGVGAISDRMGTRVDTAMCCISVLVSLILLMLKIPLLIWIAVVLFGVGFGGMTALVPVVVADHFGWKYLSTLTGALMIGASSGNALGPWIGGLVFDVSDSYFWALALSAALTIVALAILMRMPSARESRAKGQALVESLSL